MIVYDAENQILGRLSSVIAKQLLKGEKIFVVNAEKAVLAGSPRFTKEKYMQKYKRGDTFKGPFFPKQPERIFRRTVRGMLPWDRTRGRNAFRNLKVFTGLPEEFNKNKLEKVEAANSSRLKCKYITLNELSISLGAKKRW